MSCCRNANATHALTHTHIHTLGSLQALKRAKRAASAAAAAKKKEGQQTQRAGCDQLTLAQIIRGRFSVRLKSLPAAGRLSLL